MEFALALGIFLVGGVVGALLAHAITSDGRLRLEPTEHGSEPL